MKGGRGHACNIKLEDRCPEPMNLTATAFKIPTLLWHLNATDEEYSKRFVGGGGLDTMTSKIIYILTYFEAFILCLHCQHVILYILKAKKCT